MAALGAWGAQLPGGGAAGGWQQRVVGAHGLRMIWLVCAVLCPGLWRLGDRMQLCRRCVGLQRDGLPAGSAQNCLIMSGIQDHPLVHTISGH